MDTHVLFLKRFSIKSIVATFLHVEVSIKHY